MKSQGILWLFCFKEVFLIGAIKSLGNLNQYFNNACELAVEKTCNRLLGTLQELIDSEFYDVFDPEYYKRTYQFWESAITKMLDANCGAIFMDESRMNYNDFWTGEKQLYAANIGSHGGIITEETKDHRFWDKFIGYCELHAIDILKEELQEQGLNVK